MRLMDYVDSSLIRNNQNPKVADFASPTAYALICKDSWNVVDDKWKLIWSLPPHRVKMFMWLVFHGAIFTNEQRAKRHIATSDKCDFCPGNKETLLHVLRDCLESRLVWNNLLKEEEKQSFFEADAETWLLCNIQKTLAARNEVPWFVIFCVGCWQNWKWRNDCIFSSKIAQRKAAQVRTLSKEYLHIFQLLKVQVQGFQNKELMVHWIPPDGEWVKLNTDGAMRKNDNCIAAGGIVRDSQEC